ncbi:Ribose-phosphate pyrophosphokinase [Diplonema papillatum]|nr:Ribose-phosphate pyrophosphokinase [Diplonema papillatum]
MVIVVEHPGGHKVVTRQWHYYSGKSSAAELRNCKVFAGTANPQLCEDIAEYLGTELSKVKLGAFRDGERVIEVLEPVEGKHVYIIQPVCRHEEGSVNDALVELILMISCVRRAAALSVTAIIPYFGYARQDRKMGNTVPISAADVAHLLSSVGVSRVVSIDLHCGQIQGFFPPNVPVDDLSATPVAAAFFAEKNLKTPVVVSPDAGGVRRAKEFRATLDAMGFAGKTSLAMIIKQRRAASQIERMDLVGDVRGRDCVVVDDMTDTSGTLVQAAKMLKENGAERVFAFCTHGVLSPPAGERIRDSELEELVIANTVPLPPSFLNDAGLMKKVRVLSLAPLLAEAVRRLATSQPLHNRPLTKPKL